MTTISNRGLVLLILMTLALSVFSAVFSHSQMSKFTEQLSSAQTPTGFATASQSGTASINLSSDVAFILNLDTLDWGSGIVNQTNPNCVDVKLTTTGSTAATLNTNNCWINSSTNPGAAFVETDDFTLENTGTSFVNVSINGTNSTNFFGFGSASSTNLTWRGATYQSESNACGTSNAQLTTTWTEFDDESSYDVLCGNLGYDSGEDQIIVELNMSFLRSEVVGGEKTAYVHFLVENASVS